MFVTPGTTDKVPDAALVASAAAHLDQSGWVVLRGCTNGDHIRALGAAMMRDASRLRPHSETHRVRAPGHIGQVPPLRPELMFCDIVCNPTVVAIAKAVMGGNPYLAHYTGHTLMPGATRQPIHLDLGHLWPNLQTAHPLYMLAVNIAVIDVDEENGSMEIWDASHRVIDPPTIAPRSLCLGEEGVAKYSDLMPMRISLNAGDILLRDMRLWHRGRENASALPRPMMWSLLAAEWYRGGTRARLPIGARDSLTGCGVLSQVEWVPDDIDYLLLDL
jgi:hypothetical protein